MNTDLFLSHAHRRSVQKGTTVLDPSREVDAIYYVTKGVLTVLLGESTGKERILGYLNEGEFFGEEQFFSEQLMPVISVQAKTGCDLAVISYEEVRKIGVAHPEFLLQLARQTARQLGQARKKIHDLMFLDVTARIARHLLDLTKFPAAMTHPLGIQIFTTRQDIGLAVDCSREMAGRVLQDFHEQGLIDVKGKRVLLYGERSPLQLGAVRQRR